jgi:hypothetical protein
MPEPLRSLIVHTGGSLSAALAVAAALTGLFWLNGLVLWLIARLLRSTRTAAFGRLLAWRPALLVFLALFTLRLVFGESLDPIVGAVGAGGTFLGIALVSSLVLVGLWYAIRKAWLAPR